MTLCKFYQQGNCRNGNQCRFEHTLANDNRNSNRFGAFNGGGGRGGGASDLLDKYNVSTEVIQKDLTNERPQWILSAYGPGRGTPEQLFGGNMREQSFEEMRLHYMTGKASGNEQQALNQAQELYRNAEAQLDQALRDLNAAAAFVVDENKHPSRREICTQGTQGQPFGEFLVGKRPASIGPNAPANPFASNTGTASTPSAFGQPAGGAASGSAFGQPSALGQRPNPFGAPSQPAASSSSSPFGQPPQGQPAFGQPSQPAPAFGQPSALGAKPNPFGTPAFGQTSQPSSQGAAFGQPSQLGQKPNLFASNAAPSAFGAASNANNNAAPPPNPFASSSNPPATTSPFASAAASNQTTTAAPNPFASPSSTQGPAATNPFASNASNANEQSSPFGQAAQSSNPFGSSNPAPANPFATPSQPASQSAPNPFASKPQTNGAFGQASNGSQSNPPNPFAQPSTSQPSNPFGTQPATTQTQQPPSNPYAPGSSKKHPPLDSYSTKGMDGRLQTFKGKPVAYKNGKPGTQTLGESWTRIWFPNGPPPYYRDTELAPSEYDDKSKAQWDAFARTGKFAEGLMPDLPPPRELTLWDF